MNRNHTIIKLLYVLMFGLILFSSCKEDEDPKQETLSQLQGEWIVESYTEDGVESIGWNIDYFEMIFDAYQSDEGDFKWTLVYETGITDIITGEYECNFEGDELELSFRTGDAFDGTIEFEMTLDPDDLILQSTFGGYRHILIAEK